MLETREDLILDNRVDSPIQTDLVCIFDFEDHADADIASNRSPQVFMKGIVDLLILFLHYIQSRKTTDAVAGRVAIHPILIDNQI
jgi:hypothetical protein